MAKSGIYRLFNDVVRSVSLVKYRTIQLNVRTNKGYGESPKINHKLKLKKKKKLQYMYSLLTLVVANTDCILFFFCY